MNIEEIPIINQVVNEYQFTGEHIIAEIYNVSKKAIFSNNFLHESLKEASYHSGATILDDKSIAFHPSGCTSYIVFSESHASIHTYPEKQAIFFDAFTCGSTLQPLEILKEFCQKIGATDVDYKSINRGYSDAEQLSIHQKKAG